MGGMGISPRPTVSEWLESDRKVRSGEEGDTGGPDQLGKVHSIGERMLRRKWRRGKKGHKENGS